MLIPYAEQQLDTVAGVRDSLVNQRLILQCEYLIAKNRVLRRRAAPLGRRALYPWGDCKRLARSVWRRWPVLLKPETILAWYIVV